MEELVLEATALTKSLHWTKPREQSTGKTAELRITYKRFWQRLSIPTPTLTNQLDEYSNFDVTPWPRVDGDVA